MAGNKNVTTVLQEEFHAEESVNLPVELVNIYKIQAKKWGVTPNHLIREALKLYIKEGKKEGAFLD